ncbi:hypothetical protein F383_00345 [Gossypium arboreum]|uniref:Uncharacterized protein n=1 Tax=Gossypium arboreum TaxID=29729 RepID=A0A0B0MTH7_GOSAR|nr:hypothetical protein F383_24883 [Gossypium arboreum]KHG10007.1 hypothetical protein F383_00345 [Gossypium arboreum]
MTTFTFHLSCKANERISFTHFLGYESTIVNDATYYRSRISNTLTFDSLFI